MALGKSLLWIGAGYTVLALCALGFLIARRQVQPVKFRGPWLVALSGFGGYVCIAWLLLYLVDIHRIRTFNHDAFCTLGEWVVWIAYPLLVLPYLLRAGRLFYIFHPKHNAKMLQDSSYWRQLVVTEGFLLKILSLGLIILTCLKVTKDALNWDIHITGFECGNDSMPFWISIHVLELCCVFYVLVKLRSIRDDYGVVQEFMLVCGVWFVSTGIELGLAAFQPHSQLNSLFHPKPMGARHYHEASAVVVIIRNVLIFFISVVWAVYNTYAEPFVPLWSNCDALKSLDSLLKDFICVQYFRNYLTMEGRVENILCWVEIELYRDMDSEELHHHAQRIFDKYLGSEAELEVQVSERVRQRVALQLERGVPTQDTFREVQHELFLAMNQQFPRFLASDSCRDCLKDLEKEEHLRSVLEFSNMI